MSGKWVRVQPVESRLNHLLIQAKNEVREAEEELGSDSREFANYCAHLTNFLLSKRDKP